MEQTPLPSRAGIVNTKMRQESAWPRTYRQRPLKAVCHLGRDQQMLLTLSEPCSASSAPHPNYTKPEIVSWGRNLSLPKMQIQTAAASLVDDFSRDRFRRCGQWALMKAA